MPEFSLSLPGVFCAGNAGDGGVVSSNGSRVVIGPSAGNAHFLNGVEFVCQSYGPHPPKLVAVNVLTGASRDLLLDGVNKIVAGADHWFAVTMHSGVVLDWLPVNYSVRAFAGPYMAWFPWNGTGLIRRGPDGDVTLSTTLGPEETIQLFPDGGCVWAEGWKVHSYGIPDFPASPVTVAGGFGWVKAFRVGSVWWLTYQSYALESVVAHPATELIGYRWPAPNAFRLDVTLIASQPRLIWSRSNADSPADIELRDIDLSSARVDLATPMQKASFWCGPSIGSQDMVQIFDDPATLAGIDVFGLVTQNILNLGTDIGPNTFEALQANHAFQKLQQAGIPLAIEGGTLSDLEVVQKIRDVKGDVTYFSYSEPLTYTNGLSYVAIVDKVVHFIEEARKLGVATGWLEAWPHVDMATQIRFLADLIARGAKPAYWHLDIDWHRSNNDPATAKAIHDARAAADAAGVPFGCFVNSTIDPIATDAQHAANVLALAKKIHGIIPDLPQVHVAAWAQRWTGGPRNVPNNLGANGLIESFRNIRTVFGAAPAPNPPEPVPPPEPHMNLCYSTPVPGFLAGALEPHPDGGSWLLVRKPNGKVLCITPDGGVEERASAGPWERFRKSKNGASLIAERERGTPPVPAVYVLAIAE